MYELVLRTNDKNIDVCTLIKKMIGKYCLPSFYGKKLDTKSNKTYMYVCEMEDKNRHVIKASLNPYANAFPPRAIISLTILAHIKNDSIEVSLIVSSDDSKMIDSTFVDGLVANGFKIIEKNV